tara:strand:- start:1108 stop:1503 length:396 start_codon:yes stop_codon:yes gene_type:complete
MIKRNPDNTNISIPVSLGEVVDKLTILEIKSEKMSDNKLKNINKEMLAITNTISKLDIDSDLISKVKEVNLELWEIEDKIRLKESINQFDEDFISLARSVYIKNDLRASLKREINIKYNSDIIEEKSYQKY